MTCDYDFYWLVREALLITFGVLLGVWVCLLWVYGADGTRRPARKVTHTRGRAVHADPVYTLCECCGGWKSKQGDGDTCECGRLA